MTTEVLTAEVVTPETQAEAVVREAQQLLTAPYLTEVKTQVDYNLSAAEIVALKSKGRELEDKRTAITGPLNKSLKAINDLFRGPAEMIKSAISNREVGMKVYIREQDRIRQEAEAIERKRLEALRIEQEQVRKAAEAKLEEARRIEDEAKGRAARETNPFLTAIRESEVLTATESVQEVSAEVTSSIREVARIDMAPVSAGFNQVKAAGTRINRPYKWEYVNKDELPREYLMPNEQLINATVRTLKGDAKIPGIRIYQDISIGGR